ncbi:MAG: 23S rRNA (pseudouridine(1915)-N(3))-methyltransferase RlmH [Clostridia bacterium]|nr:23S rRNA (pseudouridine(1915)-N(3))-methyltransferase RlmH [Clostridia bacterium]
MNILVLCVGKLKEAYFRDAAAEYVKRLSRYHRLSVLEVPDLPEPKGAGTAEEEKVMLREGESLLRAIKTDDHVIALCVDAPQLESEALAKRLSALEEKAKRVVFVIGGSLGLSRDVLGRADERMSMSKMTFPHQLARVMLLEQIYRSAKINSGERYHK